MKRMRTGLMGLAVLLSALAEIEADRIVTFEEFQDGENLYCVDLGGVILANPSGKVEVFANRFGVSSHSLHEALMAPLGGGRHRGRLGADQPAEWGPVVLIGCVHPCFLAVGLDALLAGRLRSNSAI